MRKLQNALLGILLFSLPGCANSRLRKDFNGMLKSNWPARTSPFAQKCDKAGEKLADGVNQVGKKLDDSPIDEGCGSAQDAAEIGSDKLASASKDALDQTSDKLEETKESAKEQTKKCWDWIAPKT